MNVRLHSNGEAAVFIFMSTFAKFIKQAIWNGKQWAEKKLRYCRSTHSPIKAMLPDVFSEYKIDFPRKNEFRVFLYK